MPSVGGSIAVGPGVPFGTGVFDCDSEALSAGDGAAGKVSDVVEDDFDTAGSDLTTGSNRLRTFGASFRTVMRAFFRG